MLSCFTRPACHNPTVSDFIKSLYDIRVRPDGPQRRPGQRACGWQGCKGAGEFRAPQSPTQLREHRWFCLDHIRTFNASWDFFAGMSEAEIESFQSTASTWHRPTRPLGGKTKSGGPSMGAQFDPRYYDPIGVLDDGPQGFVRKIHEPQRPRRPELNTMIRNSLAALDLDEAADLKAIKARYKQLVKQYHPDTNGGDQGSEDRLKRVIQAYRHLVASGHFR